MTMNVTMLSHIAHLLQNTPPVLLGDQQDPYNITKCMTLAPEAWDALSHTLENAPLEIECTGVVFILALVGIMMLGFVLLLQLCFSCSLAIGVCHQCCSRKSEISPL